MALENSIELFDVGLQLHVLGLHVNKVLDQNKSLVHREYFLGPLSLDLLPDRPVTCLGGITRLLYFHIVNFLAKLGDLTSEVIKHSDHLVVVLSAHTALWS